MKERAVRVKYRQCAGLRAQGAGRAWRDWARRGAGDRFPSMQNPTDPHEVPSNATSSVCSDQAHDNDLSLHAVEWSDEDRECQGDGRLRVGDEDREVPDDPDDKEGEDSEDLEGTGEGPEVQDSLLRLSGARAPEILRIINIINDQLKCHYYYKI